jgi:hypothetical protein
MAVAVQQIPGTDFQSANLDRFAEIDDVGIGVRNREIPRKQLKIQSFYRREVANGAIGDASHAIQSKGD